MPTPNPTPQLVLPGLDKPVVCVTCLAVVADLADVDVEAKLLGHRCRDTVSRWAA
jgi:hypothetical protein